MADLALLEHNAGIDLKLCGVEICTVSLHVGSRGSAVVTGGTGCRCGADNAIIQRICDIGSCVEGWRQHGVLQWHCERVVGMTGRAISQLARIADCIGIVEVR